MKLSSLVATVSALALLTVAGPALAGPGPDLSTSTTPPAPALVKTTSRHAFTVTNTGDKHATGASVAIALPPTHTSPQVYVLGQVVGYSAGCSLAGTTLTCNLGTVQRNTSRTVWVDLALQVSAAPLVLTATASAAGDTNPANNSASHTADVLYHPVIPPVLGPSINRHCTGTGLIAWYECTLFPGSISQHTAEFHADGTITFPGEPDFSGSWSQNGSDHLAFTYYELGTPIASFEGRGASPTCFEGLTTFDPPWVAPYEVCF